MRTITLLVLASLTTVVSSPVEAQNDLGRNCVERAEALREACLRHPRANEEECQSLVERFLASCEDPGDPPPVPEECAERCAAAGSLVRARCLDLGRGEEECDAVVARVLEACLAICERPGGTEPPSCEERCQRRAESVEGGCREAGGDEAECAELGEAHLTTCLAGCDGAPRPTCEDRCGGAATAVAEACIAAGGDEEDCAARADGVLENCLRGCERQPAEPCALRCAREGFDALRDCLAAGGNAAECTAASTAGLRDCLAACAAADGGGDDGDDGGDGDDDGDDGDGDDDGDDGDDGDDDRPEPPTCEERCERAANSVRMSCLEAGNSDEECDAQAAEHLEACLGRCDGPSGPPECGERCAAARERVLEGCLARGGDEDDCAVIAERVASECGRHCEGVVPPDCNSRCERGVRGIRSACEAAGASAEECHERVAAFLEGCRGGCAEPPPPPPTCEERCARRAEARRTACEAAGGDEAECDAHAADSLAACEARCDGPDRPEPPTCEDRCERGAERVFAACIAEDRDEEECRAEADAVLDVCLVRCNHGDPLPCDERCAQIARELNVRCQEAGGEEDECTELSNRALERCMRGCDGGESPDRPEPPTCEERCSNAAERLAAACTERGGNEEECADLVAKFSTRCHSVCERGQGGDDGDGGGAGLGLSSPMLSEQLCAEKAVELLSECVGAGLDTVECERFSQRFEQTCVVVLPSQVDDWYELAALAPPRPFTRGDANRDGVVDIADPVNTLNGIFLGSSTAFEIDCLDRLDSNDDGDVDISDGIFTLLWLFVGGEKPPAPGPFGLGHDPTFDLISCNE